MAEAYASNFHKVMIIGAGPAGYTAAIYAARANLKPILITGSQAGGQLMMTSDVENFPGFAEPVAGPWLMEQMRKQAEAVGVTIVDDTLVEVDVTQQPVRGVGELGDEYYADAAIIATGARARWLGIPSEQDFSGFGVSACATCDGIFFRDKRVVVVGGGNAAVEEAIYLARIAFHVTLVHRRDKLRAEKIAQDRLSRYPNIDVKFNSVVDEILGTEQPRKVTAVRLRNPLTEATETAITDGVFVAIGHEPASALFRGQIAMDETGYITVGAWSTKTSLPWVHSAGDVSDSRFRQAVTSAAMGCMAALETDRYLSETQVLVPTTAEAAVE